MKDERFVWDEVKVRARNHLPHVDVAGGLYFVTYCLNDAIPSGFLVKMAALRHDLLNDVLKRFGTVRPVDKRQIELGIRRQIFSEMDRGRGRCELAIPAIGELVIASLLHFQEVRYLIHTYCVMPNHVHVVFQCFTDWPWWKITGGWKSFTSKEASKVLCRSGKLWQDDSFETLIRSEQHLERANRYVLNNPAKAGLKDWPWLGHL